jgi:hypothetical protein
MIFVRTIFPFSPDGNLLTRIVRYKFGKSYTTCPTGLDVLLSIMRDTNY